MRRLLLLLLPSLFHTTTLLSPFALADATAEVGECVNDEGGTCASDDNQNNNNFSHDEKLCTIYLQDERTNIDGANDENASSTETNGENDDNKHNNNNSDTDNNKQKYNTIHCSEKEIAYLLEMDAKSILERETELATLETIVKTAMEAHEENQNDASLWSAMQYNILKQLQDITNINNTNGININDSTDDIRYGPNGDRLISPSLLSTKVGKGGAVPVTNPIWLAVMGRVYDVTAGEGFYKFGGGGYSLFAGRDASPCFATGNFTVAGAEEPIGDLDGKALAAILEWMEFYEKSEKYEYVGVLAGGIFYDEEGRETEVGRSIREKATKAKEEADRVKEEKKREREKRRAERMKNKKNKK